MSMAVNSPLQEDMVALITGEVIKMLRARDANELSAGCAGKLAEQERKTPAAVLPEILILGGTEGVPQSILESYRICAPQGDLPETSISRFEKVCISKLTFAELADIAAVRDEGTVANVAIQALLCGKPVLVLEKGLPHRAFKGKVSAIFYQAVENYVNILKSYGITFVGSDEGVCGRAAETRNPVDDPGRQNTNVCTDRKSGIDPEIVEEKVITEAAAERIVRQSGCCGESKECSDIGNATVLRLKKGVIVTPSAKDVFRRARIEIEFCREEK